jgi:hypothetical protein
VNVQISGLNYARPLRGGASSRPGYRNPEECEKVDFFYFVKVNTKRFIRRKVSKRKVKTEHFNVTLVRNQRNFLMNEDQTTSAAATYGQIRNFFKFKLLTVHTIIDRIFFLSQLYVGLSSKCENRKKLYQVAIGILNSVSTVIINLIDKLNLQSKVKPELITETNRQQSNFIVLAFLLCTFMFMFCKNSSVIKINSYYNLTFAMLMCRVNKEIFTLTVYCYFILMIAKLLNTIVLEKGISKSKVLKVGLSKQNKPRNVRRTEENLAKRKKEDSRCWKGDATMTLLTISMLLILHGIEINPGPKKIDIITYNCNGLGERKKLKRLVGKLNKRVSEGALIFLQETHIVNTEYFKQIWKHNFVSNCKKTNSAGVMILFNNKYEIKQL